tara:strand:+ start:736 stop:1818 length:1083 start_codon:yes stop_codon:yes gene_type:complete
VVLYIYRYAEKIENNKKTFRSRGGEEELGEQHPVAEEAGYSLAPYGSPGVYSSHVMEGLTDGENTTIGVVAAATESIILQPTLYWKMARQQGLPFTVDPRLLYRGIAANLVNGVGQLAIGFGVTGVFKRALKGSSGEPIPPRTDDSAASSRDAAPSAPTAPTASSAATDLVAATGSGVVVAFFATPVELVMIQQQMHGGGMLGTPLRIIRDHGAAGHGLLRGLFPAAVRDGLYMCGLLGITPIVQRRLHENYGMPSSAASLAASVVGGLSGAVLSHPFDVVKTCMQGDLKKLSYGTFRETWKLCWEQGKMARGIGWRAANISATAYIANECSIRLPAPLLRLTRGPSGPSSNCTSHSGSS